MGTSGRKLYNRVDQGTTEMPIREAMTQWPGKPGSSCKAAGRHWVALRRRKECVRVGCGQALRSKGSMLSRDKRLFPGGEWEPSGSKNIRSLSEILLWRRPSPRTTPWSLSRELHPAEVTFLLLQVRHQLNFDLHAGPAKGLSPRTP